MDKDTREVLKLCSEDIQSLQEMIPTLVVTHLALVRVLAKKQIITMDELKVAEEHLEAKYTQVKKEEDAQKEEIKKQMDG